MEQVTGARSKPSTADSLLQVADHCDELPRNKDTVFGKDLMLFLRYEAARLSEMCLRAEFSGRSLGIVQKLGELGTGATFVTFSDVGTY
jgi:hypothetical protein